MSCNTCNHNPCSCNTCYSCPSPSISAPVATIPTILQYASIVLDPVKLFAAPLAKYTIVPAPGAGYIITPISARGFLKVVTSPTVPVAYNTGFGIPVVNFNIGSNVIYTDPTILGGLVDQTRFYSLPTTLFTSTFDNLPLEVGTNLLPIAGNSSLYIRVLYAITPL